MQFQIDTRQRRPPEVRVGQENQEQAVFRKSGSFIHNFVGEVDGAEYRLKLAAPWNGFRARLLRGEQEVASAKKHRRMHAFDAERPLVRHQRMEFALDVGGRSYLLTPEDRHGLVVSVREGDEVRGKFEQREFDRQKTGDWEADLEAPDDWSVPLAGFVAWLLRESRDALAT